MKRLEYIFIMFAAILLTTSCSKDDLLPDGSTDAPVTGQTQTYTFTVSPDITMEGDARTRSEGTPEEMPTRCLMQAVKLNGEAEKIIEGKKESNGNYTFTAQLASNTEYTYLFYADNSKTSITDLAKVASEPQTVIYAATLSGTPDNVEKAVTLKHIVTKISLMHTGSQFAVNEGDVLTFTYPCADSYNISKSSPSAGNYKTFSYTFDAGRTINDGDEICSFYTIAPSNKNELTDITLKLYVYSRTISDVDLQANTHIVLQGDLSEAQEKSEAYKKETFLSCFYDENGNPKGDPMDISGIYIFRSSEESVKILLESYLQIPFPISGNKIVDKFGYKIICIDLEQGYVYITIKDANGYETLSSYYIYYQGEESEKEYPEFIIPELPWKNDSN